MGAFHWKNGLFFERNSDRSVTIYRLHEAKSGTSTRVDREDIGRIPAEEWASIISSVSERGETGETWREALKFHGAPWPETPAAPPVSEPPKAKEPEPIPEPEAAAKPTKKRSKK